jgi:hypothetical protein
VIDEPFDYLYNSSFSTGCVPDELKIAKIVPVFKNDDPSNPENY